MRFFLKRWMGAIVLVVATYNPTGWCYLAWVDAYPHLPASIVVLLGFVLMVGFVHYVRKSLGAVGGWGIAGLSMFFACILWVLNDLRLVDFDRNSIGIWALLFCLTLVLAIASSWPELRRLSVLGSGKEQQSSGDWLKFGEADD